MDVKIARSSIRIMIHSLINTFNQLDLPEEEMELALNTELNIMTNILIPEYAWMFLEELLDITKNIDLWKRAEAREIAQEIITKMLGQ
ncbi:MAG TPA: hypothetical protein P5277_05115 [Candidatus Paceibacterota bacterium]|nr:hypothetical protein [Candidatus Paceibacterota bacterium]